jgi:glycosyltransferase involved in cell wall biosynthesis
MAGLNQVSPRVSSRSLDAARSDRPCISVIIPMLDEKDGLPLLFSTLRGVVSSLPYEWEIIAVDDGSTDGTREAVIPELERFKRWKAVLLARNFGQQAAYRAGLEMTTGDAVIFLDADLQDPPEVIPQLIHEWERGYKVVTACRESRAERGLRRWLFDLFHLLFYRTTNQIMPLNSGMFSLVDRVVVNHLLKMNEVTQFLPALKCWFGFPQATVTYARRARAVGEPKQSLRRLFAYALNGLFSFSDLPLLWIGVLGLIVSLASFGYAAILVLVKLAQMMGILLPLEVKGFTTLAVSIFCLSGVQLLSIGIVGQYIARIYREIKARPIFIVERVISSNGISGVQQTGQG